MHDVGRLGKFGTAAVRGLPHRPGQRSGATVLPPPRLAQAILVLVLLGYFAITGLDIISTRPSGLALAVAALTLTVTFLLQLYHSSPQALTTPASHKVFTLTAQGAVTYLPVMLFHWEWGSMAGFLCGSLLLLLPAHFGWPVYGLVGASMLVLPMVSHRSLAESAYLCESTLITGLVVYGLSRLSVLVGEVHASRGELARMAVSQERLRFSRDLHDLLGYSLSAISLKSELIRRLITSQPERAVSEVTEVLAISRQSLADVRMVASLYRDMSLTQEVASAQSVLTAADVEVRVDLVEAPLDQRIDTVLATVLREAVTNLLRHSQARVCSVDVSHEAGWVRLSITNDGAAPLPEPPMPHSGSGLGNLATRLRAVGGSLEASSRPDGVFTIVARAPARPVDPPAGCVEQDEPEPSLDRP